MNALQIIYILNLNICENSFPSDDDDEEEEEDENNSWKMIHNQCWWCIASKQSDWFQGRSCHRRGQGLGWELHHLRVPVGREIPMPKRVIGWSRWFFSLKGAKGLFLKGYLILRDGIYVHMYLYTVYIHIYIFIMCMHELSGKCVRLHWKNTMLSSILGSLKISKRKWNSSTYTKSFNVFHICYYIQTEKLGKHSALHDSFVVLVSRSLFCCSGVWVSERHVSGPCWHHPNAKREWSLHGRFALSWQSH